MKKKITAIVVGFGDRSGIYVREGYKHRPEEFEVVGVVDPDDVRLKLAKDTYSLDDSMLYHSIDEVLSQGKIADCVINGTMDQYHIETSIPFLKQGYDMLLEKPVCNNLEDLMMIRNTAEEYGCKLIICHVLRYSPFYALIKKIIDSGEIGTIMSMETSERVGVAHSSVSYIRGKWNKESYCGSGMLLAKCCHDIDLACWLNNATKPVKVISVGGRDFVKPTYAPEGAGERCMVDCPHNGTCKYSAENLYIKHETLPWLPFQCTGRLHTDLTREEKIESLKTNNPHGVCAYKTDMDIVDHQTVTIQFANGSTLNHTMTQGSMRAGRNIFIQGTDGEIEGWAETGEFVVRTWDYDSKSYIEKKYDMKAEGNNERGHFGGDKAIVMDFINYLQGEPASISCTHITDSIYGHMSVYAAEKSRLSGGMPVKVHYEGEEAYID